MRVSRSPVWTSWLRVTTLIFLAINSAAATLANAQYMYIDTNGDGVHDSEDFLTQATDYLDIWLTTDRNRDGSAATCVTGDEPLAMSSYEVCLRVTGAIALGDWVDNTGFAVLLGEFRSNTEFYTGRGGNFSWSPGTYRLGRLEISNISPGSSLQIVESVTVNPNGYCAFGTPCLGNDYDNTYKLGSDWFDADGVEYGCSIVDPSNQNPSITAPQAVTAAEGEFVSMEAIATDPDATDQLEVLVAGAPTTLVLSGDSGVTPVVATLSGTLGFSESPAYDIAWEVTDVACGYAVARTSLVVANVDLPPVVSAPATVSGTEGVSMGFTLTAGDPDGDMILELTAVGLPLGATLDVNAAQTLGIFTWTPAFDQAGAHTVIFSASNLLTGTATTVITVVNSNRLPQVVAPGIVTCQEGMHLTFDVSVTDLDNESISSLQASGLPLGATFTASPDNMAGTFSWTPTYGQSGSYMVTFSARDASGGWAVPVNTRLEVVDVNRNPIASANGPYDGVVNVPLTLDGTGSSDPDGDPLTYSWDLGDGHAAEGPTPVHAYATGGRFTIVLSVGDGVNTSSDTTYAQVQDVFEARAFTFGGNRRIRLSSGKPSWCAQIEPVAAAYTNTAVRVSSISMEYAGERIFVDAEKPSVNGDRDRNGVEELTACFAKPDLRLLFVDLPAGANEVTVRLAGDLTTGGRFEADITVDVIGTKGELSASVSPNPVNPQGTLTFETTKPGKVRVALFDLQGRLVRRLWGAEGVSAGFHEVVIDGRREDGRPLPSGIYFYRIETVAGLITGRLAVAK